MLTDSIQKALGQLFEEAVKEAEKRIIANIGSGSLSEDKILDADSVAEMYNVSSHTIYSMCRQKKIPHRKLGNRTVFSYRALEKWGLEQDSSNYKSK